MNIRPTILGLRLALAIGVATSAHAGILGGGIGGGMTAFGGVGGTLNQQSFSGAGQLGAAGQFERPTVSAQPAKSAAKNAAGNAADKTAASAGKQTATQNAVGTQGTLNAGPKALNASSAVSGSSTSQSAQHSASAGGTVAAQ